MMIEEKDTGKGNRIFFLDNLKTFIIFLVILYHAGGVYEATGLWAEFWIVDDPATNDLSGLLGLIWDIFVMATMFFVSGYFVPPSLKSKSGREFLIAKFKRLIVPWIIAVLTLVPLYKFIFLYSRSLPQENWLTYFHFSNPNITGQGHLWFLPLLFAFNTIYLIFSKANIRVPNISLKSGVIITFFIGWIYSTGMDIFSIQGWVISPLLDFQKERILIYFMFFLLGALSFRLKVFDEKPKSKKLYSFVNATFWLPITGYIIFLLVPFLNPGGFIVSVVIDRVIVWFFFHLSLLSIVYTMIETFRRYLDKPGKLINELNKNSYYVYIIHIIVLGGLALLLFNAAISSILKYLILAVSTIVTSNLIVSLYYRISKPAKKI